MSDSITIKRSDVVALCKAYTRVAGVRMGDTMDDSQHGDLVHDVVQLDLIQRRLGIEAMDPAKMDRIIAAFKPEA